MPVAQPSGDLRGFPRRTLAAGSSLWRIHRADRDPWWFSGSGDGRFDLPAPAGTCYLATRPAGAFVEVFRDFLVVPAEEVACRRLSRLRLAHPVLMADLTAARARRFGVTAELHATGEYAATQAWAAALAAAGLAGLLYLLRHDPSAASRGVALFGPREISGLGAMEPPAPIGNRLLDEVQARFGIRVLPTP